MKTSVVALCPVTVGINLAIGRAELRGLGLVPGSQTMLPPDQMESIRLALLETRGSLPIPRGGGELRGILATPGANSLVSSSRINSGAIENSDLTVLDGSILSCGPESEAAASHFVRLATEAGVPLVITLESTEIVESYRSFFESFAPRAQFIAGNLKQAAVLLRLDTSASLGKVKSELRKTSINAIITLDREGAFGTKSACRGKSRFP